MMQQQSKSNFNPRQFLGEAETALKPLFDAYVVTKSGNRQQQLSEYRRVAWYYKGVQWLVPAMLGNEPTWLPATNELAVRTAFPEGSTDASSYTLNLMTQDVDIVSSIMARVAPKATVVSDDARHQVPTAVREAIDRVLGLFDAMYNVTAVKLPLARWAVLCPGGLFAIVRPVADPGRFGWSDEPVYEQVELVEPGRSRCVEPSCGWEGPVAEICPGCGSLLDPQYGVPKQVRTEPRQTGTVRVPNIGIDVTFRNVATTYCSEGARSLEDATHVVDLDMLPIGRVMQQFKDAQQIAGLYPETMGDFAVSHENSTLEQELMSSAGDATSANKRRVEVATLWLDPAEYVFVAPAVRAKLQEFYPRGCRTTWVKRRLVEIVASDFRDEVAMVTHDGQPPSATPSRFRPYMDGQTIINELYNMVINAVSTMTPTTFVPSNLIDANVLNEQRQYPSRHVPVMPGLLSTEKPYTTQPGALDGAVVSLIASVIARTRESVGITDMIRGTGDPETARAAAIGREQSLQAFQAPYQQLLRLYVRAMTLYVMMIARYRFSRIWVPRSAGKPPMPVELNDLGRVLSTAWRLQVDETLPMTRPDMKAHLSEMMNRIAAIPAAAEALGFGYSGNALILSELMGMQGWSSQTADAIKVLQGIFDSILEIPLPSEVQALGPAPKDKDGERAWMRQVAEILASEESLVQVSPRHVPLELVVSEGGRLLNTSDAYRSVYRSNYPGWLRCDKYLSTAAQMLKEQQAAAAPPGAPGAPSPGPGAQPPAGQGVTGQVPDGTQMLPALSNAAGQ
jgi:hypothetical protein